MLYYLFDYLEGLNFPGARMFQYTSFRSGMAILLAMFISLVFGKRVIVFLREKQMGEIVRDLGLKGQVEKAGTPTMGGLIIIMATLVPTLLFASLGNIYIIILLLSTIWLGTIGFIDDYIKVFRKNKDGLKGKFKVLGQVSLGIVVGLMLYLSPSVTVKHQVNKNKQPSATEIEYRPVKFGEEEKTLETTMPFVKGNEFNYSDILFWLNPQDRPAWAVALVFIFAVIFIITAVSNGANLTDGIDGLAAGSSAVIMAGIGLFVFVSGNIMFADYLNIMFIPRSEEVLVFCGAFLGGLVGFVWYNTYPAQIFMGDTGSLTIGGIIAVLAIIIRKELLLPVLCGIFFCESLSVMLQVSYFKYTKKRFGEGRRIFLMSPLHHHFQKLGYHESKIVVRAIIIGFVLAIVSIITLKIR